MRFGRVVSRRRCSREGAVVRLAKAEAAGNDFLVVVDPEDLARMDAAGARALADRRTGIGADGIIGRDRDGALVLYNADGSRAEMSGNGLRCLGHVLCVLEGISEVAVSTPAGPRRYRLLELAGARARGETTMGAVRVRDEGASVLVDVTNPHEVRFVAPEELDRLDVVGEGTRAQAHHAFGANVEWVAPVGERRLRLRVFERGVGETAACGTGSTAAAMAAVARGLVPSGRVWVHNPGGTLVVDTGGDEPTLEGPSRLVGWVEVDLEALLA
jgi:diaminopimelate epimerase